MRYQERLQELKRKKAIANLCRDWNEHGIGISPADFLEVRQTLQFQEHIAARLDESDQKNESILCSGDMISGFADYLLQNIRKEQEYIFFEAEATRIGALRLKGGTILEKRDFMIQRSEIIHGGCSIFFCSTDMESGVCLWRGEYDCRVYVW